METILALALTNGIVPFANLQRLLKFPLWHNDEKEMLLNISNWKLKILR